MDVIDILKKYYKIGMDVVSANYFNNKIEIKFNNESEIIYFYENEEVTTYYKYEGRTSKQGVTNQSNNRIVLVFKEARRQFNLEKLL